MNFEINIPNIDLHEKLLPYDEIIKILKTVDKTIGPMILCSRAGRKIYQIYSKEFIMILNNHLEDLPSDEILEVMSGDGKLVEFLSQFSTKKFIKTDNKSWPNINYLDDIIEMDAMEAVKYYNPSVVLMCWEPYCSTKSVDIVKTEVPLIWIGEQQGGCCGSEELFANQEYYEINMHGTCLARTDSISDGLFGGHHTSVFLFNWPIVPSGDEDKDWWQKIGYDMSDY